MFLFIFFGPVNFWFGPVKNGKTEKDCEDVFYFMQNKQNKRLPLTTAALYEVYPTMQHPM